MRCLDVIHNQGELVNSEVEVGKMIVGTGGGPTSKCF